MRAAAATERALSRPNSPIPSETAHFCWRMMSSDAIKARIQTGDGSGGAAAGDASGGGERGGGGGGGGAQQVPP